ncbi:MAG: GHKL domain-containing protein [Pseudomonadota bacterium]
MNCHFSNENIRVVIEESLFKIVITNLIKNAFQHSSNNAIEINVNHHQIQTTNAIDKNSNLSASFAETSFGVGLQLIERICDKLHWQFQVTQDDNTFTTTLSWIPEK